MLGGRSGPGSHLLQQNPLDLHTPRTWGTPGPPPAHRSTSSGHRARDWQGRRLMGPCPAWNWVDAAPDLRVSPSPATPGVSRDRVAMHHPPCSSGPVHGAGEAPRGAGREPQTPFVTSSPLAGSSCLQQGGAAGSSLLRQFGQGWVRGAPGLGVRGPGAVGNRRAQPRRWRRRGRGCRLRWPRPAGLRADLRPLRPRSSAGCR